jgi:hypothetical protein
VTRSHYAIGVGLVEFLVERGLITLKTDKSLYSNTCSLKNQGTYIIRNYENKGTYMIRNYENKLRNDTIPHSKLQNDTSFETTNNQGTYIIRNYETIPHSKLRKQKLKKKRVSLTYLAPQRRPRLRPTAALATTPNANTPGDLQ